MKVIALSLSLALLSACSLKSQVVDLDTLSQEERSSMYLIDVYMLGNTKGYPEVEQVLGPVTGYSCKRWFWDDPATKREAMDQAKLQASKYGADAIIDLTMEKSGTSMGHNCWESAEASGMAVVFKK